ncbi:MAG TPA: UPF0182 family protein, partial [Gemmatimonadales bacterium]|nr:UPF0182 family protein [Gemmatimonadales bacterium]
MPHRRQLAPILLIAALLLLFFLAPGFVGYLADWWWFQEIGYQIVFTRTLVTQSLLFLGVGGLAALVLYFNLWWAQRHLAQGAIVLRVGQSSPRLNAAEGLHRLSLPAALFFGFLAGIVGTQASGTVLQAIHQVPFGIADPIFSRDIGFYVFTL